MTSVRVPSPERVRVKPRRTVSLLAVALVVVAGAGLFAGVASGAAEPRERVGNATAPVVVFQGERLNVSGVEQSGGETVGSGTVEFEGLSGDAEGESFQGSASGVDFADVPTGAYDTDVEGVGKERELPTMWFDDIDEVRSVADRRAFEEARRAAAEHGVLVGGSSGAAIAAAREIADDRPDARIAVIGCDGGEQYFDTLFDEGSMDCTDR